MAENAVVRNLQKPKKEIEIKRLHLDTDNPRLSPEHQGKSEKDLLHVLLEDFDIYELAVSMATNGYFDEEPLVVVPIDPPKKFRTIEPTDSKTWEQYYAFLEQKETQFTVVEGNRRLAAAKLLLDPALRSIFKLEWWPKASKVIEQNLSRLPAIVYQTRDEVIPYLGTRHIVGIKKWEAYEKARYITEIIEKHGYTIEQVQTKIGDKSGAVIKSYVAYHLVDFMEDESAGSWKRVRDKKFSYLLLSLGQGPIKEYVGLPRSLSEVNPKKPVPKAKIEELKNLFSFLFGDEKNSPIITDSRDITKKLVHILNNKDATEHLVITRNLEEAYDLSPGEEISVLNKLKIANRNLEFALGKISRIRTQDVIQELKKTKSTLESIFKILDGK